MAVSPPPITATGRPLKKKPSQVAQVDTPRPDNFLSTPRSSHFADAPVAMISACAVYVTLLTCSVNGRRDKSTAVTSP